MSCVWGHIGTRAEVWGLRVWGCFGSGSRVQGPGIRAEDTGFLAALRAFFDRTVTNSSPV